jgi:hypothetical protein
MSCGEKPAVFLEVEKLIGLSKRSTGECSFVSMTRSQRHRSLQSAKIWAFTLPTPDHPEGTNYGCFWHHFRSGSDCPGGHSFVLLINDFRLAERSAPINRELTPPEHHYQDLLVVTRIESKPSLGIRRRLFRRSPDELLGLRRVIAFE